jgi:hypothetical protein
MLAFKNEKGSEICKVVNVIKLWSLKLSKFSDIWKFPEISSML